MALISSVFLNEYFQHKRKAMLSLFGLSFALMILPGSIALLGVYAIAAMATLVLVLAMSICRRKVRARILMSLVAMSCTIAVFGFYQKNNLSYGARVIHLALSKAPPNRWIGLTRTFVEYPEQEPLKWPFGVGLGNYSSRAAFIVGGDYLRNHPWYIPITPSRYFKKYMSSLYSASSITLIGALPSSSAINEPFVQYQTLFGEGGVIAIVLVFSAMLIHYRAVLRQRNNIAAIFLLFFIYGCFWVNNWISFPNFAILYWVSYKYLEVCKSDSGIPIDITANT
jgi:hypothetical protein